MGSCFSSYQVQHTSENSNARPRISRSMNEVRQSPRNNRLIVFSYQILRDATGNFQPDQIIGDGGFGRVYKGEIFWEKENGGILSILVAVKKLNLQGYQGDREWLAEVNYLGGLRHPNLVRLIGYCCQGMERLLVYEYMAYGSLERHLFYEGGYALNWKRRMKIILDVAKGLAFLHEADRPIIYRDFKTSNILLDKDLNAKISDFGLAKEGPEGSKTHVSTRVMGTDGYAAPEYLQTGKLTLKHDVYGFGVVLLEMLTGRTVIDMTKSSKEKMLVEFVQPHLVDYKKLKLILDPHIEGQYRRKDIHTLALLAGRCINPDPKSRPFMKEVVQELEAAGF